MGLDFWDDLDLPNKLTEDVVRDGQRYRWARNENGCYLKSVSGQVGQHLSARCTPREFAAQAEAMARPHAQFLTPEVQQLLGQRVQVYELFTMAPCPSRSEGRDSSAIFL